MLSMPERRALIVANDTYQNEEFRKLRAPAQDADALAGVLTDPAIGGYQTLVLHNEPAHAIREAVEDLFSGRNPDDVLLLYFSCHGLKSDAGELYLAAPDTKPALLNATAVAAEFVNRVMANSRARRIALLLDCCYGGAYSRGMLAKGAAAESVDVAGAFAVAAPAGRGHVVITASSATQYAFEGDLLAGGEPAPSLFTDALVHGLRTGEADLDRDGIVEIGELFAYVEDRVRSRTAKQTPQMWALGKTGPFALAALVPSELPAALRGQAAQPDSGTRLGAVRDLRRILLDWDLALASAALNLLRALADDDSALVSAAARSALAEARLTVVPDRLDFGPLSVHDSPPEPLDVRLIGPPIAQVRHVTSRPGWLSAELTSSGLRVTVTADPAGIDAVTGPAQGSVSLVSPLGTSQIAVTARSTGRIMPGTVQLPGLHFLSDRRALPVSGALLAGGYFLANDAMIGVVGLPGLLFVLLNLAVIATATVLLSGTDPSPRERALGAGLTFTAITRCLADAVITLRGSSGTGMTELLAVALFAAVLAARFRLPRASLRLPRMVSPSSRPLSFIPLAASVGLLVTAYNTIRWSDAASIQYTTSVAAEVGLLGLILWIAPIGLLCIAMVLIDPPDRPDLRLFAAAALGSLLPEVVVMLTALMSGNVAYPGNDEFYLNPEPGSGGLIVVRIVLTIALATPILVRRDENPASIT
jgi:hypothetical protein